MTDTTKLRAELRGWLPAAYSISVTRAELTALLDALDAEERYRTENDYIILDLDAKLSGAEHERDEARRERDEARAKALEEVLNACHSNDGEVWRETVLKLKDRAP